MQDRRFLLWLTVGVGLFAFGLETACTTNKTSDRDLIFIEASKAPDAIRSDQSFLGFGSTTQGVYVDPRSDRAFRAEHIPGAINLPFQSLEENHGILDTYDVFIIYGDDYNDPVAIATSKTLMNLGYEDVKTLRGGLSAWKNAGQPVEGDKVE